MATKEALALEAATLGETLGVAVDTAELSHADLLELVGGLRAQQREAAAAEPSAPPPPPPAAPAASTGGYVVAAGKSLYCMRGQLKAGEAIKPQDFTPDELKALAEKGVVEKA